MKPHGNRAPTPALPPRPREREQARRVLRELVRFCLANDPRELASAVERSEETRAKLALLTRWFEKYEASLPPRIQ